MGINGQKWDINDNLSSSRLNQKTVTIDTAANLSSLSPTYANQLVIPTDTDATFTSAGQLYKRNNANSAWELAGGSVTASSTTTFTNKTINATDNTITDSSTATGDILKSNGTKFLRLARGTVAGQALIVNSGSTDITWSAPPPRFAVVTASGATLASSSAPTKSTVTGTNHAYTVLDYADASTQNAYYDFKLPAGVGTSLTFTIKISWIATVTTGAVVWEAAILGRISGEAWDTALGSTTSATTTTSGVAGNVNETTITLSSTAVDASDYTILRLSRLGAHASDTLASNARFLMASVEW